MYEILWPPWLQASEPVAVWLEAIALIAIFVLDWKERKENRKERQEQHEETAAQLDVSRKQVEVSQEQVEATQKPFMALSTARRTPEDAILNMGGIVGAMVVLCPGGDAEIGNVGSGPAVNVHVSAIPTNPASSIARPTAYLVGMLPGDKFLTPIPRGILQGNEWEITITYESLSGRAYRTTSIVNDLVLTDIEFEQVATQDVA
jgi:hypothetical protein